MTWPLPTPDAIAERIAGGMETAIAALRRSDPDALFDQMNAMVRAGYAQQMKAGREG